MSLPIVILVVAICLSLVMAAVARAVSGGANSGWIDATWSFATGIAGVVLALAPAGDGGAPTGRQWLVAALCALWSLRLGLHIAARTLKGGDDPRYAALKKEWGESAPARLLLFLQIQAAVALLLALTVMIAARNGLPFPRLSDFAGIAFLVVAVSGEGIADRQLARFRADPANRGKVCDIGLWGLSRHPNYFFEWLGWMAYPVIAIDLSSVYLWGWLALVGPAFMYWLLVHVSGVPPLEKHMLASRGEAFRRYQARVNAFWPGPPRHPRQAENPTP